jgi:hypothetical protein
VVGRGGGLGVDMVMGHNRVLTLEVDVDHGWLGCSTTGVGKALDGRKKLLYLIFPIPLCYVMPSFF